MKRIKLILVMFFAAGIAMSCNAQEKPNVTLIDWNEAKTAMAKKDIVLVDVRTPEEYNSGTVEGAENIDFLDESFREKFSNYDKEKPVYIFCQSGNRSGKAANVLSEMGFEKIYDIEGGYRDWEE